MFARLFVYEEKEQDVCLSIQFNELLTETSEIYEQQQQQQQQQMQHNYKDGKN